MKNPEIIVTDNRREYTQARFEHFGGELGFFDELALAFKEYSDAVDRAQKAVERFSKAYGRNLWKNQQDL